MHRRFIDTAIDAAEAQSTTQADHAFRWTVETLAPLLRWLETSSRGQVKRFLKLEKMNRIEVTGMFLNTTPLADIAAWLEMLQPIHRLRRQYGIAVRHAMNCDVNGHNWGLADLLLDAGIEGLTMAINEHAGGAPFERPNLFRWQAPSGRRLPAFNGWHYAVGHWLRLGQDVRAFRERWLPAMQKRLDQVGWPLPCVMLQMTNQGGDNATADIHLSRFIRDWNQQASHPSMDATRPGGLERPGAEAGLPRIKFATPAMWWDA